MEMLVVIGMIAIVTAVALPKIKDIYEEFRINQTVEETVTLISSYRSYYLIMNEFPKDARSGYLSNTSEGVWFFPKNTYIASSGELTIKPYKGTCFDFSDFTTSDYWRGMLEAVILELSSISDNAVGDKYRAKFSNLYPRITFVTRSGSIGIPFQELPKKYCESEVGSHRNRYH